MVYFAIFNVFFRASLRSTFFLNTQKILLFFKLKIIDFDILKTARLLSDESMKRESYNSR